MPILILIPQDMENGGNIFLNKCLFKKVFFQSFSKRVSGTKIG